MPAAERGGAIGLADRVRAEAKALSGLEIESISAMTPRDAGGYSFTLEAIEAAHVPNDRDIMCTLIVDVDAAGVVAGLRRDRRYRRGDV